MNPVTPPDLPNIHSVIEQLDSAVGHVPDWLWQNLVSDLIHDGLWAAAVLTLLAWKHRKKIAEKLRWSTRSIQVIHAGSIPSAESFGSPTITVGSERQALWDVRSTVGSERQVLWRVEAPTLTERLVDEGLELLSWYLRQA